MSDNIEITLYNAITSAKVSLLSATTQIMEKSHLPACVMDGIICDILSEIRKQEIYDMNTINRLVTQTNENKENKDAPQTENET